MEEEGALLDEELDDCLVGARGCEGVHGAEVWPHQGGPEADGQVLTGHEVHLVVVADSVGNTRLEVRAPATCAHNHHLPSCSPAPTPPCKLRTAEAPGLGVKARAPLALSSESPEVGDTALAEQKGSVSVPQQGSYTTTLQRNRSGWKTTLLWEKRQEWTAAPCICFPGSCSLFPTRHLSGPSVWSCRSGRMGPGERAAGGLGAVRAFLRQKQDRA